MSEMGILSQLSLKTVSISLHEVSWDLDFLLRVVVPPRRSCRCLPGSHWKVSGAKDDLSPSRLLAAWRIMGVGVAVGALAKLFSVLTVQ